MAISTIASVVSIIDEGASAPAFEHVSQADVVYLATWFYLQRRRFTLALMEQGYERTEAVKWSRRAMKKLGLWYETVPVAA